MIEKSDSKCYLAHQLSNKQYYKFVLGSLLIFNPLTVCAVTIVRFVENSTSLVMLLFFSR